MLGLVLAGSTVSGDRAGDSLCSGEAHSLETGAAAVSWALEDDLLV